MRFRRAAEEPAQPRSEQPQTRHLDKFTRHQQQHQNQQQEDDTSAAAEVRAARDAADIALRAAVSDGGFVPEAQSEYSNAARANTGPNGDGRTRREEEVGRGWRDGTYAAAAGGSGVSGDSVGKKWLAVNGDEDGSAPAAKRDVDGVGKWGAFEDVPAVAIGDKIDVKVLDTAVAGAAAAIEEPRPKDNIRTVGPTREERPQNHEGGAGTPSGAIVDVERLAGTGGGVDGVSDEVKPYSKSEGKPPAIPTAASGEVEGEQGVVAERQQEEDPTAGVSSNGAEAPTQREKSRERMPQDEEQTEGEGEERRVGDGGIRTENEIPTIEGKREMKEATEVLPGAIEAAVAESRAAGSSNTKKSIRGEGFTSGRVQGSAESQSDGTVSIREASERAKEIRSSTRNRPPNVEKVRSKFICR